MRYISLNKRCEIGIWYEKRGDAWEKVDELFPETIDTDFLQWSCAGNTWKIIFIIGNINQWLPAEIMKLFISH